MANGMETKGWCPIGNEEGVMRIFLATWLEDNQGLSLQKKGARNRLMSYYFLREAKKDILPQYVMKGQLKRRKKNEDKD
jgi:hypothetical protein